MADLVCWYTLNASMRKTRRSNRLLTRLAVAPSRGDFEWELELVPLLVLVSLANIIFLLCCRPWPCWGLERSTIIVVYIYYICTKHQDAMVNHQEHRTIVLFMRIRIGNLVLPTNSYVQSPMLVNHNRNRQQQQAATTKTEIYRDASSQRTNINPRIKRR